MGSDGEKVVTALTGSSELFILLLILGDDSAVVAHDHVTADDVTPVVLVRDVGIEADEAGEAPCAPVGLSSDFFVMDSLEQLPPHRDALSLAALRGLVQE